MTRCVLAIFAKYNQAKWWIRDNKKKQVVVLTNIHKKVMRQSTPISRGIHPQEELHHTAGGQKAVLLQNPNDGGTRPEHRRVFSQTHVYCVISV